MNQKLKRLINQFDDRFLVNYYCMFLNQMDPNLFFVAEKS